MGSAWRMVAELLMAVVRGTWHWVDRARRVVWNLVFLALVVAGVAAWLSSGPPALQDKTVLVLDLAGPLVEQFSGSSRDAVLSQLQDGDRQQVRLRDVLGALDAAAQDARIASVLLLLEDLSGGGLQAQREVAAALERFKASGKPVVAWGTGYDQRQYYLAAHANEVYLHPMGSLMIQGYGRLRNYYRDALERVGVSANVVRVGKYKNAAEPYFASGPSKETEESDAALYDALWSLYTQGVEKARHLPAGALASAVAGLPGSLQAVGGDVAQWSVRAKLVDGLKTIDPGSGGSGTSGSSSVGPRTRNTNPFDRFAFKTIWHKSRRSEAPMRWRWSWPKGRSEMAWRLPGALGASPPRTSYARHARTSASKPSSCV